MPARSGSSSKKAENKAAKQPSKKVAGKSGRTSSRKAAAAMVEAPIIIVKESAREEGRSGHLVIVVRHENGREEPPCDFPHLTFDSRQPVQHGGGGAIPTRPARHPGPNGQKEPAHWIQPKGLSG